MDTCCSAANGQTLPYEHAHTHKHTDMRTIDAKDTRDEERFATNLPGADLRRNGSQWLVPLDRAERTRLRGTKLDHHSAAEYETDAIVLAPFRTRAKDLLARRLIQAPQRKVNHDHTRQSMGRKEGAMRVSSSTCHLKNRSACTVSRKQVQNAPHKTSVPCIRLGRTV